MKVVAVSQCFLDSRWSGATEERLHTLSGADEGDHDEHADSKQHRLQNVGTAVVEPEQNRQRPASGEGRAK